MERFRVFIQNLCETVPEHLLYKLFERCGPITNVVIFKLSGTTQSRGLGFVEFLHKDSANRAISIMNGSTAFGRQLYISAYRERQGKGQEKIEVTYERPKASQASTTVAERSARVADIKARAAKSRQAFRKKFGLPDKEDNDGSKHNTTEKSKTSTAAFTHVVDSYRERTIVVRNLDYSVSETMLRRRFESCGVIEHIKVIHPVGRAGFAFLAFKERYEAALAIHWYNGRYPDMWPGGKPLQVTLPKKKVRKEPVLYRRVPEQPVVYQNVSQPSLAFQSVSQPQLCITEPQASVGDALIDKLVQEIATRVVEINKLLVARN